MPENSPTSSRGSTKKGAEKRSRLDHIKQKGISASSETLIPEHIGKHTRRPRCSSETRPYSPPIDTVDSPRVPPVHYQPNELQPRSEVWPEITAIDLEHVTPEVYESMHARGDRKESIHLVDSFNSPRTKRTQYYHLETSVKQILLLGERYIQPKNANHGGVFNQRVAYSEIRSIANNFSEPNKSIMLVLTPKETRHSCFLLTFDTFDCRNQAICTILWRADCLRFIDELSRPNITSSVFESLHTKLMKVHLQPSKLTLLTSESYQITLHNASALSYLADSIVNIYTRVTNQLIVELARSATFIEHLDQFLQYIQIPCPQISKILELHCTQPSKTPLSELVIRHTVTKAMNHPSFDSMLRSEEIKACSRLTCVYLNHITGGHLPYIEKGTTPPTHSHHNCCPQTPSGAAAQTFVNTLHGQADCSPHLLTLNNIKKIAKMAILQCYQTSEDGLDCCLTYPSGVCYYAKRFEWAKLGIDLLIYASDFEDWGLKLSETILPSFLPESTRTCKNFGDQLPPLLEKLLQHGNPMKLSGLLPHARPDAITWLSLSSTQCDSTSTCLSSTVQSRIFKAFLTTFNQASPQPPPTVLKNLAERYFNDIINLSYRKFQPAIDLLIKCLNAGFITSSNQRDQANNYLRLSNLHETNARQQLLLTAPGGKTSMRFKKETTDREVLEYLHTERGGDLEHLDLASTDITDFALTVIVNLPKLKRLNLMTTRITDEGLFTLSYAAELTNLNLNECEFITPTGIRYLGRLHKLTTLYINSTKCNDEAIEELRRSLPKLEDVDLRYTDVSNWC